MAKSQPTSQPGLFQDADEVQPAPHPKDPRFEDLTGKVFSRLTVLSYAGRKGHTTYWHCRCSCGTTKSIAAQSLKSSGSRSCGCILSRHFSDTRACTLCKRVLPFTEDYFYYHPRGKNKLHSRCKDCITRGMREKYGPLFRQRAKMAVFSHYSSGDPRCACCGESHIEFLTIDHIHGGGHQHRKSTRNKNFYTMLKHQGFPDGYRVLCMNCNFSIGTQGYCPHRKLKTSPSP